MNLQAQLSLLQFLCLSTIANSAETKLHRKTTSTSRTYINPNTFSLSSLSRLSHLKLTPSKGVVPPDSNPGPLTNQSLDHPCQATPVTPPGQQFYTCIIGPVSMTQSDQFLHFLQQYFVRFSGVRVKLFCLFVFTCMRCITLMFKTLSIKTLYKTM